MVFTYFLQALDKGTMSFASIMGIQTDLGLVRQQFSWLTTCIYIAVLAVEYPTNFLIQRIPIAKYLGVSIMLWGTTLALHSVAKNFTAIVILRTLLGIFEAVCQPAFVFLSSMWYKREEQAATVTYVRAHISSFTPAIVIFPTLGHVLDKAVNGTRTDFGSGT